MGEGPVAELITLSGAGVNDPASVADPQTEAPSFLFMFYHFYFFVQFFPHQFHDQGHAQLRRRAP